MGAAVIMNRLSIASGLGPQVLDAVLESLDDDVAPLVAGWWVPRHFPIPFDRKTYEVDEILFAFLLDRFLKGRPRPNAKFNTARSYDRACDETGRSARFEGEVIAGGIDRICKRKIASRSQRYGATGRNATGAQSAGGGCDRQRVSRRYAGQRADRQAAGRVGNANALADGTIDRATVNGVTARPIIFSGPSENETDAYALTADFDTGPLTLNLKGSISSGTSDGGNDAASQQSNTYVGQDYVLVTRQAAGNNVTLAYDTAGSLVSPNFNVTSNFNLADPGQYEGFTVVDQRYLQENRGRDLETSAQYDLGSGILKALKVGGRYEKTSVFQSVDFIGYSAAQLAAGDPTPGNSLRANEVAGLIYSGSRSDFLSGAGGAFPRSILTGSFDIDAFRSRFAGVPSAGDIARSQSSIFDVDQRTLAAYGMLVFGGEIGSVSYSGNAGLRYVSSRRTSSGFDLINATTAAPRSETFEFDDTLPSFNLTVQPTERLSVRLAAAKVTARPPLALTGVGISVQAASGTGSAGNPALRPFNATQYDASVEWYFAPASFLSAAYFRKDVSAFTTFQTTLEDLPQFAAPGIANTVFAIRRPVNGTDGSVEGLELNYYHAFSFLPAPLDGLSFERVLQRGSGPKPRQVPASR